MLATAKRVAKRKRLVSAQPQETTADGTPSDEPKSRKLHQCELVGSKHVSPHSSVLKARIQRAASEPFGTPFFNIFRRATKDGAAGGTGSIEKNQLSKYIKLKSHCPEGCKISREVRKNVKQTSLLPLKTQKRALQRNGCSAHFAYFSFRLKIIIARRALSLRSSTRFSPSPALPLRIPAAISGSISFR